MLYELNEGRFRSVDGGGYGQNLAIDPNAKTPIVSAVSMWTDEAQFYSNFFGKEPNISMFEQFGHFTQVAWKGTTHVGCATTQCADGVKTVCNYKPPGKPLHNRNDRICANFTGNVLGHYAENVGA